MSGLTGAKGGVMEAKPETRLQILITWERNVNKEAIREALTASDAFEIVGETESQSEAVALAASLVPDAALIGAFLSDGNGLATAREILNRMPLPVIMLTAILEPTVVDAALDMRVCGYLTYPAEVRDYIAAIHMAIRRFHTLQTAMQEAADLREALETRNLIKRAKGIVQQNRKSSDVIPQDLQETVTLIVACRARRRRQGFDH